MLWPRALSVMSPLLPKEGVIEKINLADKAV